ncbi:MAG: alpha/beta fold hydrolase [Pikeienuella sp.]
MIRRTFMIGAGVTAVGAFALAACSDKTRHAIPANTAEAAHPPLGRLIDIGGMNVHATEEGSADAQPVVLIHGANVNLRDWTWSLSRRLSKSYRVIAMDRPGFGYSDRPNGDWTPAKQAAALRAAAQEMGADQPIVVGHSWGASVALGWAIDAPDSLSGVVSVSGATMPWGTGIDILSRLGVSRAGANWYTSRLARQAEEGAIEDFVTRAFYPQSPPHGYLNYVGAPLSQRAITMNANADDLATIHRALSLQSRRYSEINVPVEMVHGRNDWLLEPERHVDGFRAVVPHANAIVADNVGHMAHHARPTLLVDAVNRIARAATQTA